LNKQPQTADRGCASSYGGVAANTLNKQPQTADKGCASNLEVGFGSNNLTP
jgi:hypothetical protein